MERPFNISRFPPATAENESAAADARQGRFDLHLADAFEWMAARPSNSTHAIVTDPPYGLKEFTEPEKDKLRKGHGGVWRIPPSFDGCKRSPLPRFTVLGDDDLDALERFFETFARHAFRILVPGGHVVIASNPLLSHHAFVPIINSGFEKRGEIIRMVQTLRGGFGDASFRVGTLGIVSQAAGGPGSGQFAQMEDRRPSPCLRRSAVPRRYQVDADTP
jgi:site-specific DNA-methyltransferase (adenine-specific)